MFKKAKPAPKVEKEVVLEENSVTYHLDVDPNDPRNRKPAGPLPSLDD